MGSLLQTVVLASAFLSFATDAGTAGQDAAAPGKFYRVVDGKADARTYDGFRRYHSGCDRCHGPDGVGSTFAPSLVSRLPDIEAFRRAVLNGRADGGSVMKGFADDPNFAPYVDDIYAYLQARADGSLGRGRPGRLQP
ncbi:c-type cytochrome [Mesorhizobium sp. M1E.F.Ca.ET.041.01.1.1]|uniref:c-type cytochrome n=1 Tax=Mesorhizobium sp. M1E.F.Ca.ET.041.01.1.1 TaxID=2496759 RepID=UPI000FCC3F1D|nr:c-type cytochrome [Mesorhizobium sp. M1E.F.Ca.ET.041.01.1.1]RUW33918.1 cytochrome C [Mesorhizobium sp. M1E.F.Ca.ET.041.01.1.1]RWD88039.1 MAG: cytochrome C [Mesorhizobium sp.]